MNNVVIKAAIWDKDQNNLKEIRRQVFIEEQKIPEELEWDVHDSSAYHCIAWLNDKAVACGRLQQDGQLGRMAVLKSYRHQGIGYKVLKHLVDYHQNNFTGQLFLHAQEYAIPLYEKAGFIKQGNVFFEAGIAHFLMLLKKNKCD